MHTASHLSRRERQIMDVLYRRGQASVAEVIEGLPDPPSYSAVRATLRILEEKGHATHSASGPRYVYAPTVPTRSAREAALSHLVKTFFEGSHESAAVALLQMSDMKLSSQEVRRIQDRIRKAEADGR